LLEIEFKQYPSDVGFICLTFMDSKAIISAHAETNTLLSCRKYNSSWPVIIGVR
jgi:hypothetical protein